MSDSEPQVNDGLQASASEELISQFWFQLPRPFAARKDITPATKIVWSILADMARTNGSVFFRKRTIAEKAGLGLTAVADSLSKLAELGFVAVEQRPGTSNLYTVFSVSRSGEPIRNPVTHPTGIRLPPTGIRSTTQPESGAKREQGERTTSESMGGIDPIKSTHHGKSAILSAWREAWESETNTPVTARGVDKQAAQECEEMQSFLVAVNLVAMFRKTIRELLQARADTGKNYPINLRTVLNNANPYELPTVAKEKPKAAEPELEMYRDQTNYASDWPGMGRSSK